MEMGALLSTKWLESDGIDHATYAKTDRLLYGMRRMYGKLSHKP